MYQFLVIVYFCTFKLLNMIVGARTRSRSEASMEERGPLLVSTRILLYQLVSARESVVLDREQCDPTDRMGSQHILTERCVCLVQD